MKFGEMSKSDLYDQIAFNHQFCFNQRTNWFAPGLNVILEKQEPENQLCQAPELTNG